MMKLTDILIGVGILWFLTILIGLFFIKFGWWLFMVPVFNLPDLTWMQALGFSFLSSAFKSYNSSSKKD